MLNKEQMQHVIDGVRNRMIDNVSKYGSEPCIALSGGIDSTSILFAALASGAKPRCFTFSLEGFRSPDVEAARSLCSHFGLSHQEVVVPSDSKQICRDVKEVGKRVDTIKKTIIQCCIPWLHICTHVQADVILTGLGADDLYCNQRKVQMALREGGEEAIAEYRKTYTGDNRFSNYNIIKLASSYGVKVVDMYHDPVMNDLFRSVPEKQLDDPFEKHISVRAFAEYFKRGSFRRPRQSYQIASGIRSRHDALLSEPFNKRKRKAVIALYRDIIEGVINV